MLSHSYPALMVAVAVLITNRKRVRHTDSNYHAIDIGIGLAHSYCF